MLKIFMIQDNLFISIYLMIMQILDPKLFIKQKKMKKQDEKKQDETEQEEAGFKILTPKQMLQRLPIALASIKEGNNSESLLNEIRKIVYSLYQSK